jgi:signal transduction histidine kinase/DNA-binding LacI/PurR family transcriptional regulator/AraC-like DNA-binding protein/ActR/RegA family two-component response regulator
MTPRPDGKKPIPPIHRRAGTPRRPRAANGFPTVGFLLADMHAGASNSLWPGVADEAAAKGVNLICFPGGRLGAAAGFEAGRNPVYNLARPECLDGLLTWASSLEGFARPGEVEAFHKRYRRMPMVSLAEHVLGAPMVSVNAYRGTRDVIAHLIDAHGVRRIAFIRGPAAHASAEERFRAYADELAAHGIAFSESLATSPLGWDSGEEAVRILLDERRLKPGPDFQAVAAASDLLALWAMKAFQARGYRVPGDLLFAGFNDTAESRLATPPLTTAAMPFREQGARALDILVSLMAGEDVPRTVALPSTLVIRQSCGCPSAALAMAAGDAAVSDTGASFAQDIPELLRVSRAECIDEMAARAGIDEQGKAAWLEPLFDAFLERAPADSPSRFLSTLDTVLDRVMRADMEITSWQGAISVLRRRVLHLLLPSERPSLDNLFTQTRFLIAEAADRQRTYRQWQADRLSKSLRDTGAALLTTFDKDRLSDLLSESLPRLGIASSYLALFEKPEQGTEYARLILAGTDKVKADLPREGRIFPTQLLVPREYLPRIRRYDLVVEPLHFRDRQIGYAILEIGPRIGAVYEELRGFISSALEGAILLDEARQARRAAEKADLIKSRLLANVSHELRTPLAVIIRHASGALEAGGVQDAEFSLIRGSAEHQLRVINDLLDLSRAEIDELDLDLRLMDPRPILEDVYRDFSGRPGTRGGVEIRLEAADRLPVIRADAVRLRQILFNLMSNAVKFTEKGVITLSAEVVPPYLRFSVADSGPGIPADMRERIFEPFVTAEHGREPGGGIGLGLSIARHLAALHFGALSLDCPAGGGSIFSVRLPLPDLSGKTVREPENNEPVLILISAEEEPPREIAEFCRRAGLAVLRLRADEDWEGKLGGVRPAALAWDMADADPREWPLVRRLRHHPRLFQAPVVLYGRGSACASSGGDEGFGMTGFLPKAAADNTLFDLIDAARPAGSGGPILIVDDDPDERSSEEALVGRALPGFPVRAVEDGAAALKAMEEEVPGLVLLDLAMPHIDGIEVLEKMRSDPRLLHVPVIVLTNRVLDDAAVRRLESHALVMLQNKGVWTNGEAAAALNRQFFGTESLPPHTGALTKRALAWLANNHARNITRWKLADAVGASEDYVSRVFHKELGITPWEYLNRYRVHRAKKLLRTTSDGIKAIASAVGFKDQAYFSRVFRKLTGMSPQAYRGEQ